MQDLKTSNFCICVFLKKCDVLDRHAIGTPFMMIQIMKCYALIINFCVPYSTMCMVVLFENSRGKLHKLAFINIRQCCIAGTGRMYVYPKCHWSNHKAPFTKNKVITNIMHTLIPSWLSNYIYHKVWHEITCPFPNFNCCTAEVWVWISNFIANHSMDVITYPCWD